MNDDRLLTAVGPAGSDSETAAYIRSFVASVVQSRWPFSFIAPA